MSAGGYNNHVRFLQAPGYVVIWTEQNHDARIVPLDGRPQIADAIRQWMGDSRGRWEGDTLVVETTNFNGKAAYQGAADGMQLVERFTRTAADTIRYAYTVSDPETYARPWTASDRPPTDARRPLRIRLPRGQLRHGGDTHRGAGRRTGGGGTVEAPSPAWAGSIRRIRSRGTGSEPTVRAMTPELASAPSSPLTERSRVVVVRHRQIARVRQMPAVALPAEVAFERHARSIVVRFGYRAVFGGIEVHLDRRQCTVDYHLDGCSAFGSDWSRARADTYPSMRSSTRSCRSLSIRAASRSTGASGG